MHIIAADVGGTKTRLVFAEANNSGVVSDDNVLYEARYASNEFTAFEPLLKTFISDIGSNDIDVNTMTLALPGVVGEQSAQLTNLPWYIEKKSLVDTFGIPNIQLMNDFQASAFGTRMLATNDIEILNTGSADDHSKTNFNRYSTRIAVGAGTGLGVAWTDGCRHLTCSHDTEGGHIDFAPVDVVQIELLQYLLQRYEHVSYERILSGSGLVTLYEFFSGKHKQAENDSAELTARWVNEHADSDSCAEKALTLFVQIYAAYIANLALLFKPCDGIYITGGIGAKIADRMKSDVFTQAYLNKGRMRKLVEQTRVCLVTNERVGVLGALSEAAKLQHINNRI